MAPYGATKLSLVVLDRNKIAHLGTLKNREILHRRAKLAAATAENRAILVNTAADPEQFLSRGIPEPRGPELRLTIM